MNSTLVIMRFVSTGLFILSLIQFSLVVFYLRPKRMREEPVYGKQKVLRWRIYAGGTWEQRIYQTAILESVAGMILILASKLM